MGLFGGEDFVRTRQTDKFEGIRLKEQGVQKLVMQCMARFMPAIPADHGHTEQVKIANGVQKFVLHKLFWGPQTFFIHDDITINQNGVFNGAAQCKPRAVHGFNLM